MKSENCFKSLKLLFLLCMVPLWAFGQNITVKGVVKDATGQTVIGASVVQKGTTNGTISDFDGNFTLTVPSDAVLTISFVGYKTQEIPVAGKTSLEVTLSEDAQMLDNVIVVGYGTQKKEDLTSAIATLSPKEVLKSPGGITDALQGSTAGVNVSGGKIRIRGTTFRVEKSVSVVRLLLQVVQTRFGLWMESLTLRAIFRMMMKSNPFRY